MTLDELADAIGREDVARYLGKLVEQRVAGTLAGGSFDDAMLDLTCSVNRLEEVIADQRLSVGQRAAAQRSMWAMRERIVKLYETFA